MGLGFRPGARVWEGMASGVGGGGEDEVGRDSILAIKVLAGGVVLFCGAGNR